MGNSFQMGDIKAQIRRSETPITFINRKIYSPKTLTEEQGNSLSRYPFKRTASKLVVK